MAKLDNKKKESKQHMGGGSIYPFIPAPFKGPGKSMHTPSNLVDAFSVSPGEDEATKATRNKKFGVK
jgi:hypothetical protein